MSERINQVGMVGNIHVDTYNGTVMIKEGDDVACIDLHEIKGLIALLKKAEVELKKQQKELDK